MNVPSLPISRKRNPNVITTSNGTFCRRHCHRGASGKRIIQQNINVEEIFYPIDQVPACINLTRLPEPGIKTVRVIRIGDYDQCACIGFMSPTRPRSALFASSHLISMMEYCVFVSSSENETRVNNKLFSGNELFCNVCITN